MHSRSDLLLVCIHCALLTFNPKASMVEPSKRASTIQDAIDKKCASDKCAICMFKRALSMG